MEDSVEIVEEPVAVPAEVVAEVEAPVEAVAEEPVVVATKKAKKSSKRAGSSEPVYVACRKMTVKDKVYRPGDVVPEANGWLRIDTWVHTGYLKLEEQ